MKFTYVREPGEILRRSFAQVESACDLARLPSHLHSVALRLAHSCAMPEILSRLAWQGEVGTIGHTLLRRGAPIFTDCRMVASGISKDRLPEITSIRCFLDAEGTSAYALSEGMTRSAAGITLWKERIGGTVLVIGNAPTALFRLLELVQEGITPPALVLAFPVGFVGAAEAKQALVEFAGDIPFCTLLGRYGGSALAAAAVNALAGPSTVSIT